MTPKFVTTNPDKRHLDSLEMIHVSEAEYHGYRDIPNHKPRVIDSLMGTLLIMFPFVILLLSLSTEAKAEDFLGADVGVYLGSQVITNETESFQVGLTLDWNVVAIDMSHGIKRTSWRVESEPEWEMDDWQSGSIFSIRVYPFNTETWRPLITWVHLSDITRGRPFNSKEEPTSDYLGVGVSYEYKKIGLDFTGGLSGRECAVFSCNSKSQSFEAQIQMRFYF